MVSRKKRKKTFAQKIVGAATTGMPQPIKKTLSRRWVAAAIMLAVPLLLVTGLVTLRWEDGRPRLRLDRQKAVEVEQDVVHELQALSDEIGVNHR
jgi:hypothetical protein